MVENCFSKPSVSDLLKLISSERRRYAISRLTMAEEPMSMRALADEVAIRESSRTASEFGSTADTRSVRTSLYHTHIPKLADHGVVDYDVGAGTVAAGPNAEYVDNVLNAAISAAETY